MSLTNNIFNSFKAGVFGFSLFFITNSHAQSNGFEVVRSLEQLDHLIYRLDHQLY